MKALFYPRLAWTGIKNNRRLYLPYILTCVGMVAMFYIMLSLSIGDFLEKMRGGGTLASVLSLGSLVIAFFAALFLFYTNSFLIRRRKKEFGLYNILGMGKRNIARVLLSETFILAAIALVCGLIIGIALSKLAELGLAFFVETDAGYDFTVDPTAMYYTVILFAGIFLLLFIKSISQVGLSNPTELIRSESVGEKPPKANWLFGILGVAVLAAAYYISVSIKEPLQALGWFFVAVIMVIAATYLIFIAGSVLLCRILQKNKGYYYKPNHFVSVSSMVYRMKRNGAGLASICILITMVLVMISSSSCLYFGKEDVLREQYPYNFMISCDYEKYDQADIDRTKAAIDEYLDRFGGITRSVYGRCASLAGGFKDGRLEVDSSLANIDTYAVDSVCNFNVVSLDDYNRNTGNNISLADDEALLFTKKIDINTDTVQIADGKKYKVVRVDGGYDFGHDTNTLAVGSVCLVVSDFDSAVNELSKLNKLDDSSKTVTIVTLEWRYQIDPAADYDTQLEIENGIYDCITANHSGGYGVSGYADARNDFYSTFGGLFFLGIMLSIVFIFAAVLIIYYKQISEGYEDQSRFEIMQKVGMTKHDIRRSINSQMLTVFFLPLIFAILHLGFAFPMVYKLLMLFGLDNLRLLVITAGVSALIFALFYVIVYRLTSNAYYSIVSGAKE